MGQIFVQDNFFDLDTLNKIQQEVTSTEFGIREKSDVNNELASSRYYFEHPLSTESDVAKEVTKLIQKYFYRKVDTYNKEKPHQINYFLSNPKEAIPHKDTPHPELDIDYNCLIYLKGEHLLNNGTGFYENINNQLQLNTHIGFKENRAILFNGNIYHSPLQWADNNSSFRYCIANFFRFMEK